MILIILLTIILLIYTLFNGYQEPLGLYIGLLSFIAGSYLSLKEIRNGK